LIESNALQKFVTLFQGSKLAHGTWNKETGSMATVLSQASEADYRNHLEGKLGLGIIPVNEEGRCVWAAIDIDIDTIDHRGIYSKIKAKGLPLSVCRSKSGGAHLYVFFKEPSPASMAQALLRKWIGLLGYSTKTEVFPKQTMSTVTSVGNWLNLEYFNAENTVRYAVTENCSLTLEEFLSSVVYYTGEETIDESPSSDLVQIDQMPPCLKALTVEGMIAGSRNVGLFSFGVFYRKSSPSDWAEKLRYHNKNYVSPSLKSGELESLIKSISGRHYQYKCDDEPLCSHCDRKTCLSLPYGVGHKPWEDGANFDEITVNNLRKILTDPPTYIVEINSRDLHLSSDEFRQFEKIRKRVFEVHDAIIQPMKQAQWEQKLRDLLASHIDIEAPDDASEVGAISGKIDEFLCLSERSKGREDLLRGMPIIEGENTLFQVNYLQKYLMSQKVVIDNSELFSILHRRKCSYTLIRVKGKVVRAWSIPTSLINRQSEDYTDMVFDKEESEI
jgi:hypothetical protein